MTIATAVVDCYLLSPVNDMVTNKVIQTSQHQQDANQQGM